MPSTPAPPNWTALNVELVFKTLINSCDRHDFFIDPYGPTVTNPEIFYLYYYSTYACCWPTSCLFDKCFYLLLLVWLVGWLVAFLLTDWLTYLGYPKVRALELWLSLLSEHGVIASRRAVFIAILINNCF